MVSPVGAKNRFATYMVGRTRLNCELFGGRLPCELPYYGASTIFSIVMTVRQFFIVLAICTLRRGTRSSACVGTLHKVTRVTGAEAGWRSGSFGRFASEFYFRIVVSYGDSMLLIACERATEAISPIGIVR